MAGNVPHHIETSQLICDAWETLGVNELRNKEIYLIK